MLDSILYPNRGPDFICREWSDNWLVHIVFPLHFHSVKTFCWSGKLFLHVSPKTSLQIKAWLGYVELKGLIDWPHPLQSLLLCIFLWLRGIYFTLLDLKRFSSHLDQFSLLVFISLTVVASCSRPDEGPASVTKAGKCKELSCGGRKSCIVFLRSGINDGLTQFDMLTEDFLWGKVTENSGSGVKNWSVGSLEAKWVGAPGVPWCQLTLTHSSAVTFTLDHARCCHYRDMLTCMSNVLRKLLINFTSRRSCQLDRTAWLKS